MAAMGYLEVSNMPVQFRCLFPIWKFFIHYFETKNNSSNRCVLKIFASYYNNSSFDDLKDHEKGEKIEKQLPAIGFFLLCSKSELWIFLQIFGC